MKKSGLIILLSFFSVFLFSQNNKDHEKFTILSFGSVKDVGFYIKSINASNLDDWRLQDKRTVLKFDTGFEIEIFSANELKKKGFSVNVESFKKEFPSTYNMPLFKIFPNGVLGAGITPTVKQAQKK
ncbi:MAG: hypothetical protein IAF38_09575 [Bacteroidia bacterium]|nr:hypothetical protein [Bacteroidia bacterium]